MPLRLRHAQETKGKNALSRKSIVNPPTDCKIDENKELHKFTIRKSSVYFQIILCIGVLILVVGCVLLCRAVWAGVALTFSLSLTNTNPSDRLDIFTLSFNRPSQRSHLEHNCAVIAENKHRFFVYTDDTNQPYCKVCECREFVPSNCKCPDPSGHDCALCEKLSFIADILNAEAEMLYLDDDLIILQPAFLDRLYARSRVHDVLAAYGHANTNVSRYYSPFNSGLLFMRSLPRLDYRDMLRLQMEMGTNNDQNVITRFVYEHYENWDSLSLKWHCRFLTSRGRDISPTECYTLHDRHEEQSIFESYNMSFRRIV